MSDTASNDLVLDFEDASELSAMLLKHVEEMERKAADLDRYDDPKNRYGANTVSWAKAKHRQQMDRAEAFRAFAREVVLNSRTRKRSA